MKVTKKVWSGTIGAILLTASLRAEDQPAKPQTGAPEIASAQSSTNRLSALSKASTFLGASVKSGEGKEIGRVKELVIDAAHAKISYAVLAIQGNQKGERLVAVPISALKPTENALVLNMSEPVLAASEGLTDGSWPALDAFAVAQPSEALGAPAQGESGSAQSGGRKAAKSGPGVTKD